MLTSVQALVQSWNTWYSNSAVLRTGLDFAHVGGLVVAGGCAIVADRATLRAARTSGARLAELDALEGTHRTVIVGLAIVIVSGLLLLAADLDTYLGSVVFWSKMGLVVLLLGNGAVIMRAGHRARAGEGSAWRTLRAASVLSLLLWFSTTLLGAALPNL